MHLPFLQMQCVTEAFLARVHKPMEEIEQIFWEMVKDNDPHIDLEAV